MAKRSKGSQAKPAKKSAGKSGAKARARSSPQRRTASGEESFAPPASPDAVLAAMAKGRERTKATPAASDSASEAAPPPVQVGPPPEQAFADAMDRLNEMQQRFVQEYLLRPNASEAARKAGYAENSARQQGSRLLSDDDIAAAIAAGQKMVSARYDVTLDRIVGELARIGFANIDDYVSVANDGLAYVDLSATSRDMMAAVSEVTVDTYDERDPEGEDGETRTVKRVKLKLHDKRGALVDLGKHVGLGAGNGGEDIAAAMLEAMRLGMQRAKQARG